MKLRIAKCHTSANSMESKHFGSFSIIGPGSKYNYYRVRFDDTGTIDEFRLDAIRRGEIRDKYAVTLCGIGIIGNIPTKREYHRYYETWRNMITRCYKPGNNPAYYGYVTVDKRWHTFEYFYEDAPKIDGWDEELFNAGELVLDKDIKQRHQQNKKYSLETCTWLNVHQNAPIQDRQQRPFIAIAPDGTRYYSDNMSAFGRQHGFERRQISCVLHKRFKTSMGWTFHYADEEIV